MITDITNKIEDLVKNSLNQNVDIPDIDEYVDYEQFTNICDDVPFSSLPDISSYMKLPSVDINVSSVISSALTMAKSQLSSLSTLLSTFLSPIKMPDFEISAVMLSVKLTIDEIKQDAVKKIDDAIKSVLDTIKAVMTALYGWTDTSISTGNMKSIATSLLSTITNALGTLGGLPFPVAIPGLDSIMSIVNTLSTLGDILLPTTQSITDNVNSVLENSTNTNSLDSITSFDSLQSAVDDIAKQLKVV